MISIFVKENNNQISKITISGHAMYDDYGKDIVCASVSSILITTINGILSIDKNAIKEITRKDEVIIEVQSYDNVTQVLLSNMLNLLKELSNDYPQNIIFK